MESIQLEKDTLLRKLMEAEMDGMAAARQVSALRETVTKMRSSSASVSVSRDMVGGQYHFYSGDGLKCQCTDHLSIDFQG